MSYSKMNYILVDFENTQAIDVELLAGHNVTLVVFVGFNQNAKLPVATVRSLMKLSGRVEFMDSAGSGPNSLDFQMAYYAGRIIEREPTAFIHFVTKDQGFDSVVSCIKHDKRFAARVTSIKDLAFLVSHAAGKPLSSKEDYTTYSEAERIEHFISRLLKMAPASRPRKLKTLHSSVLPQFAGQLNSADCIRVVDGLLDFKKVVIGQNDSVSYHL